MRVVIYRGKGNQRETLVVEAGTQELIRGFQCYFIAEVYCWWNKYNVVRRA